MLPQLKVSEIFFRLKKENKEVKYRILRDIRNHFEHEKDCYKSVRVGNFWSKNYIKCKSKSDRKILSVKKYFHKIRPHLKDI